MPLGRPGRPLKFGRPAQLLTVTLPDDVVRWQKAIHPDPAWAIVSLFEKSIRGSRPHHRVRRRKVELAQLSGRRALIVVDPHSYRSLPGVSVIPVAAGRAFLALEDGRGFADLELSVLDRIEDLRTDAAERKEFQALLREIRSWRRSRRYRFSTRSIIVVEHTVSLRKRGPRGR